MKYTVPLSGVYQVSAYITRYTPIGEPKIIPNPNRKWWEFWKETEILYQEYKSEQVEQGINVIYLEKGQVIPEPKIIRRMKL